MTGVTTQKSESIAKGFIHERIIYEYMKYRVKYSTLRMRHIVKSGNYNAKQEYVVVERLQIDDTKFPDVDDIIITSNSGVHPNRVAEIKFVSSQFNYHKEKRYKDFQSKGGCIIVLNHDTLPAALNIDVYQLERSDFEGFVRENFDRLLSHQLLSRNKNDYKIWLFSQAPNFYKKVKNSITKPACESGIWCPTQTMTEFDLAKRDKVIFIKFGGAERLQQELQKYNKRGELFPEWKIQQLWIGEITSPIKDREEYCIIKNLDPSLPLWNKDTYRNKPFPRVFEFKKLKVINCTIYCTDLLKYFRELVKPVLYDVFVQQVAREISHEDYIKFIEYVAEKQSEQLPHTFQGYDETKFKNLLDDAITNPHMLLKIQAHLEKIEQNMLH
ncbi:hypothetical protein [Alkaliphilus transvaalensis]|uniref:hypothetical protein n=1 Tax=Alkaliphilus transvaalensis TaxID=114628 RepID=UPI00047D7EAA|nr:hypothetical protein [Alkaliphilus transvaalensis]